MTKPEGTPEEPRRGWLKNGNRPGDFSKAPRCVAKTRQGPPCQCPGWLPVSSEVSDFSKRG
jgi:hypothetical protein